MQVRFWGTRGSIAKPGPDTVRYGGNTSCVQVTSAGGTLLVVDCGTGSHALGQKLVREKTGPITGHILISHTHWDHIQGIPFFAPLFIPGDSWTFYAPKGFGESLRKTLAGQMEYTYFPITPEAFGATVSYRDLSEGVFRIGGVVVRTFYLNHPALTLGYRFEVDGAVVVYACDHEPHSAELAAGTGPLEGQDRVYAEFLKGADLVIHDSQYLASEYAQKAGWGHSTVEYAIRVCSEAGVKRLALTHHDPSRTDPAIDEMMRGVRDRMTIDDDLEVFAAAEGMTVELGSPLESPGSEADDEALPVATPGASGLVFMLSDDDALIDKIRRSVASEPMRMVVSETGREASAVGVRHDSAVAVVDNASSDDGIASALAIRALPDWSSVPILLVGGDVSHARDGLDERMEWLRMPFSEEYARSRIRTWAMRQTLRWRRANVPADEADRLEAVHAFKILEDTPDASFDRFTRLASAALDVPISLISIVDEDRQWFKSCIGLAETQTSRDASFCSHVVYERRLLVVPDTYDDDRFADNPLVTSGPRIRFYAGTPLLLPNGQCIGTLCVLDRRPRDFTQRERDLLSELGALAEYELAARLPAR